MNPELTSDLRYSFRLPGSRSMVLGQSVLLSTGAGRLHFIEAANALCKCGVMTSLVMGVVPMRKLDWLYNAAGRLLGRRDLASRLHIRVQGSLLPLERIHGCGLAETLVFASMTLARWHIVPNAHGQAFTWALFGRQSRRYLGHDSIFHVRSGAGQGGAIRLAKQRGMKVVVDHSIAHPSYIEREMARAGHRPFITSNDPFWRLVLKDCAEADVLLVNSDFVRQTFIAEGFSGERIRVAYLGVREDFFSLKNDYTLKATPRLLFTGSFCYRKGADLLLQALTHLEQKGCICELHVAGDASECGALGEKYSGASRIVFHGSLPQPELKRLLAESDIYVFPTLAEGCAKSAMEALAAGLPVVTTEACGLPAEANRHYVQITERSPEALAAVLFELLSNADRREEVGRCGADLVKQSYRWDDYGRNVAALYAELTSR